MDRTAPGRLAGRALQGAAVTEATLHVRAALWQWASELEDPDPDQLVWKRPYVDGMLDACEALALLDAGELAAWREIAAGTAPPSAEGDREAAERHLRALRSDLRPMRRSPSDEDRAASHRFHGALDALQAAGVIADEAVDRWNAAAYERTAPWLDAATVDQLVAAERGGGLIAIGVPAETDEERERDEQARHAHELIARVGALRRVLVPDGVDRHDGLAVIAIADRDESIEVLFHLVGQPHGEFQGGFADLEAHRAIVDALEAPALVDDTGTTFTPAKHSPVGSHGSGGLRHPERPRVLTGLWRYHPAADPAATTFAVSWRGHTWRLSD